MRTLITTIAFLFLLVLIAISQVPTVEWESTWGVEGDDQAYNIYPTDDSGYVAAGNTHQFNDGWEDIVFVKFDGHGNTEWARCYGDANCAEYCRDFIQLSDGGYLMVGSKIQPTYSSQYYVLRADPEGYIIWENSFGDLYLEEGAYGVVEVEDSDTSYYITGRCYMEDYANEIAFIKLSSDGSIIWQEHFGTPDGSESGYSICPAGDSCFVITGKWHYQDNPENVHVFVLLKVDSFGNIIWRRTFGEGQKSCGLKVKQTADGGFIAVGYAKLEDEGRNWMVVRVDSDGNYKWTRQFAILSDNIAFDVEELPGDTSFVVAGTLGYGEWDAHLKCIDADGQHLWTTEAGGETEYDAARGVKLTDDGGYIIAGYTESYIEGDKDFYVVKFSPGQIGIGETYCEIPATTSLCYNYPNPFNASTQINYQLNEESQVKLDVYDIAGRVVAELVDSRQSAGNHSVKWHAEGMPSGIYLYKITTDSYSESNRMILLK